MKGTKAICFIAGAAFGGVTAWYFTKKKYEALNEKDAESFRNKYMELKEEYEKKGGSCNGQEKPEDIKKRNDELVESMLEGVKKIQQEHKYTNYSDSEKKEEESSGVRGSEEMKKKIDIEKITQNEWDDDTEHHKCGITLYMDSVFTDDDDKKMDDGYLSETIGIDIRDELLNSEELGTVYVRNHKLKTDYEVLCVAERWSDVHEVD